MLFLALQSPLESRVSSLHRSEEQVPVGYTILGKRIEQERGEMRDREGRREGGRKRREREGEEREGEGGGEEGEESVFNDAQVRYQAQSALLAQGYSTN